MPWRFKKTETKNLSIWALSENKDFFFKIFFFYKLNFYESKQVASDIDIVPISSLTVP